MYAVKVSKKKICFSHQSTKPWVTINPAEIELLACIALISPLSSAKEMPVNKHNTGYLFLKYWRGRNNIFSGFFLNTIFL